MNDIKKGLVEFDGEELIEWRGFKFGDEVLLSDCDTIGDHEKVVVKITPSMIDFWLKDNIPYIEELAGWTINE